MELDQLVQAFQNKDIKAFEKLYKMYSKSMLGIINTIVKDHYIAQEVMQDVFIKAWDNADKYAEHKGRFFTWILNIARNAAIDKTRSKSFKDTQKNLNVDFFVNSIETSDSLDQSTDAIGIRAFVAKLSEKCKAVIDMIYFKGYTQKEAAETLEIPIGTIKTRNRMCLSELRKILDL